MWGVKLRIGRRHPCHGKTPRNGEGRLTGRLGGAPRDAAPQPQEETAMDNPAARFDTEWPSIRDQVSEQEWQARLDLAACYRLVDALRHDGPDLQPHHLSHPGHRAPADQPLWAALQGDHRDQPRQDRRRRQHHLEAGHGLRHQQVRLRDPRRHPQGAARRGGGDPHPHPRRHGGGGDELRAAAAEPDRDPLRRPPRDARLRGARRSTCRSGSASCATSARTTR